MQTLEHIIFDLDGTLVDSSKLLSNAINYVRSKIGLEALPTEEILQAINSKEINAAKHLYHTQVFLPKYTRWFQEYYAQNYHQEVELYEGVFDLLQKSKKRYKLSLATNAYRVSALQVLNFLEIEEFFDTIICGDDVINPKPHPEMILKTIKDTCSSTTNSLLIGDSPNDIEAAWAAGVKSIHVAWGFSEIEDGCKSVEELAKMLAL